MKTRIFTLSLLFAFFAVAVFARSVNADIVRISTNDDGWGTVYSYTAKVAYAAHTSAPGAGFVYKDNGNRVSGKIKGKANTIYTADSWERRKSFAEYYLSSLLSVNAMTDKTGKQNSALTKSISNLYDPRGNSANAGGRFRRIFGNAATPISGDPIAAHITGMMTPNGKDNARIITSSAWKSTKQKGERDWIYNRTDATGRMDGFTDTGNQSAINGVGGAVSGIYTFIKGINIDPHNVYANIDGWFSVLGTFVGIYLNGIELSSDYLTLSQANQFARDSSLFDSYNMSIDLAKLMKAGLLLKGNNNLAFMVDAAPLEYINNTNLSQIYHKGADTLVGFSSNMNINYNLPPPKPTQPTKPTQPPKPTQPTQPTLPSQPTQPTQPTQPSQPTQPTQPITSMTPEPATLLIFGIGMIGMIGLGLRRKFMIKKV
ncbi:MAG: PEP-CTERM sorting domain-containing protein [Planctomycetaceae bacterium]|jgi:hypothetical protein|nr:PEP-CTERM sorting domain-containing protein [Planctomycetaceae bacterium]